MRKNIKRFFVFLLSFMMILSAAYAAPLQVSNSNPFSDVPNDYWAIQYILDMYGKGIILGSSQGSTKLFKPEESISKVEVISLIARMMGSGSNTAAAAAAYTKYKSALDQAKIPDWAAKEVAYAMDRGVVTQDDIKAFVDGSGSQTKLLRHEAAVFIVKAMGLESTAQDTKYPTVSFTDYFSIPEASLPYIKVAVDQGVFDKNGDTRGRFNPTDQVKRSEIAKILSVSYDKINKTSGTDTTPGTTTSEKVTISSVTQGSSVNYMSCKDSDGKSQILDVDLTALVTLDGKTAKLTDIKSGMSANIELKNNVITKIAATSTSDEISGTVYSIFYGSDPIVTIEDKYGDRVSYHMADASVKKDGKTAAASDIEPNDTVTAVVSGDTILSIEVTAGENEYTGTLANIKMSGAKIMLTMDTDNGSVSLEVADDANIKRNKKSAVWTDLKKGDKLTVTTESGVMASLTATSTDSSVSGSITGINISSDPEITITNEDGDATYAISEDARIKIDGRTAVNGIYDLRLGYQVDTDVESDEIVKLNASSEKQNRLVSGTIKRIDTDSNLISLSVYDETTKKTSDMVILITSDTKIYDEDGDLLRLRDLDEGDDVTAKVQNEGGILNAVFISVE